jgi:MFS family permease
MSPFVGCLTSVIPRYWITFFAFFFASAALFMFGPSKVFNFPVSITLSTIGLAILGCSCSVIFVPLLSEIIEGVREKEGIWDSGTINDKATGVYNTAYGLGCIIAPILGGYLSMMTNFRTTCDVMAFCSIGYAVIFLCVIILPKYCKNRRADIIEITNNSTIM